MRDGKEMMVTEETDDLTAAQYAPKIVRLLYGDDAEPAQLFIRERYALCGVMPSGIVHQSIFYYPEPLAGIRQLTIKDVEIAAFQLREGVPLPAPRSARMNETGGADHAAKA